MFSDASQRFSPKNLCSSLHWANIQALVTALIAYRSFPPHALSEEQMEESFRGDGITRDASRQPHAMVRACEEQAMQSIFNQRHNPLSNPSGRSSGSRNMQTFPEINLFWGRCVQSRRFPVHALRTKMFQPDNPTNSTFATPITHPFVGPCKCHVCVGKGEPVIIYSNLGHKETHPVRIVKLDNDYV